MGSHRICRKVAQPGWQQGRDACARVWGHQAWPGGCCWGNLGAFGYLGCRCEPCHGRGAGALVGLSAEQAQHSMGSQSSPYLQPRSQIQPKTPQLNLQAGDTTQNRAVMARGEGKQTPKHEKTPVVNTWLLVPVSTWHTTNSPQPNAQSRETPCPCQGEGHHSGATTTSSTGTKQR